jgi:nitrogen regulatory protein P-II 1
MKEIKAYVRRSHIQDVVNALELAGFNCMSVLDVPGLGLLSDPEAFKYSTEFVKPYSTVVKIELACKNEDVDKAVEIIKASATDPACGSRNQARRFPGPWRLFFTADRDLTINSHA